MNVVDTKQIKLEVRPGWYFTIAKGWNWDSDGNTPLELGGF